jgi:hypothetical protein
MGVVLEWGEAAALVYISPCMASVSVLALELPSVSRWA